MKKIESVLFAVCVLLAASSSQAGLIGDSVVVAKNRGGFLSVNRTFDVTPGIELTYLGWLIDVHDYGIDLLSTTTAGYLPSRGGINGISFLDLDFGEGKAISGFQVTGIDEEKISFTDDSLTLDFSWLGFAWREEIKIVFETGATAVPEPETWQLLVLSALAFSVVHRRRYSLASADC